MNTIYLCDEVINEFNNYKVELHKKLLIGTQIHIFNLFFLQRQKDLLRSDCYVFLLVQELSNPLR